MVTQKALSLLDPRTWQLSLPPPSHLWVRLSFLSLRPVSLSLSESPPQHVHTAAMFGFHLDTGRWTLGCHLAILLSFINPSNPTQRVIIAIVINTSNSSHFGSSIPPPSSSSSIISSPPATTILTAITCSDRQGGQSPQPFRTHFPSSPRDLQFWACTLECDQA